MSVGATIGVAQVVTENAADAENGQARRLVVAIQDIDLTDKEEAQIAAIRKEYRETNEDGAKELKQLAADEVYRIRALFTLEQLPKIRTIITERREFKEESLAHSLAGLKDLDLTEAELAKIAEIRKEYRPKMDEAVKQLETVLTDAQKNARREAIKAGKTRREVLEALNLSGAQSAELATIAKELRELVGSELAKLQDVLTAGQRETLQELRAERRERVRDRLALLIADLRDLNLTDDQRNNLVNIRQEFRPKIQEVGNRLRTSLGEEVRKIVAVLKPASIVAGRPGRVQ
jgi:Spy/CpxP family protein refolding chaperone